MTGFLQDVRLAAVMMVKAPSFAAVTMLSIAVGVGASATTYSVADALLLRPLPVPGAAAVMTVSAASTGSSSPTALSYPEYLALRDRSRSFEGLSAFQLVIAAVTERPNASAIRQFGMAVSGNLFDVMGIKPAIGRFFDGHENQVVGRDPVLVLDYDTWQQQFQGDDTVLGRRLRIQSVDFLVVGVTSRGFSGIDSAVRPAFYVPLAMMPTVSAIPSGSLNNWQRQTFSVKGRLNVGVGQAQAIEDVQRIARELEREQPATNVNRSFDVRTELQSRTQGPGGASQVSLTMMLMSLAMAIVLVACANVSGAIASRAPERTREMAMRLAIGASRGRLLRQLLTEGVVIAAGGGALGLLLGYAGVTAFQQMEIDPDTPLKITFELNRRVVLLSAVVSAISALLSGLWPAWRASRTDLNAAMRRDSSESRFSRQWGRHVLVSGQIALALIVLTVAVLLSRTMNAELRKGPGFRTNQIVMMTFDPGLVRYDSVRTRRFYERLKAEARTLPGVTATTLSTSIPLHNRSRLRINVIPEGFALPRGASGIAVQHSRVDSDYFATMGISLRAGRPFTDVDNEASAPVVIVNEAFATRYWPRQDPLGQRIRLNDGSGIVAEVIGVAVTTKYNSMQEGPLDFLYLPWQQTAPRETTLFVRGEIASETLARSLGSLVGQIDPDVPVFGTRTMEDFYAAKGVRTPVLLARLIDTIGGLGLAMALIGLHGIVSHGVSRRTREIGIRIALGAQQSSVLGSVLHGALVMCAAGLAVGVLASAVMRGVLRAAIPLSDGVDATTWAIVIPVVLGTTLLASYLPARRATGVDPVAALRAE